jgi:hypothetical protein
MSSISSNNVIKKLNWEIILTLTEFKNYLNKRVLIELNLINKKFNTILKPISFESINLVNVLTYLDDIDATETEYSDSGDEDNLEIKIRNKERELEKARATNIYIQNFSNYSNFVKKLTIQECVTKLLFNQLPSLFQNLNSLTLIDMVIEYSAFTQLLKRLNLTSLNINNSLIVYEHEDSIDSFEFPSNLKMLSVETWKITDSHHAKNLNYPTYDRLYDNLEDFLDNFPFFDKLTSLTKFSFLNLDDREYSVSLAKFIELNPSIKILELDINYFDLNFLRVINSTNIEKLIVLNNDAADEDFNELEIPTLPNILSLDLTSLVVDYYPFERNLIDSCPNLKFNKKRKLF